MNFIIEYKEDIIKVLVVLLPILSMLIPKLFSDRRTRNLLGSIELGADLKANAYTQIIDDLTKLRGAINKINIGGDLFEEIKETFVNIKDEIGIINIVKEEINSVKGELIKTVEHVQELLIATHDSINVKIVIEEQNKVIEDLKEEIKKLNNRFGGR